MKNIVGSFHPESRDRVLLFAHWDTRPFADKDSLRQRNPSTGPTTADLASACCWKSRGNWAKSRRHRGGHRLL